MGNPYPDEDDKNMIKLWQNYFFEWGEIVDKGVKKYVLVWGWH